MSNQMRNPNQSNNIMVALYNFDAEDEPEISLKKGDPIEILDMDPALNGWAYARRKADSREGYVPISYLGSSVTHPARSHKSAKSSNTPRSTSPMANGSTKSRYADTRNGYRNSASGGNNGNNVGYGMYNHHSHHDSSNADGGSGGNSNSRGSNLHGSSSNLGGSSKGSGSLNSDGHDGKQIICSFHRDFIPEMTDLYKYFGEFGKITNKLEIEYDSKKVPLAKIRFQSSSSVEKVCDKGNRQQIPSGANGAIYIRVYRSMQEYMSNTQRSNRGHSGYNKHKNSRRGGF